jgi:hypothetical protein
MIAQKVMDAKQAKVPASAIVSAANSLAAATGTFWSKHISKVIGI